MLPSGSPVSNLGSQPWAAFHTGQPHVPGATPLPVDRLIPNMVGALGQTYHRANINMNHAPPVFPVSSIHSGNGTFAPHVPLGYAVHPSGDHVTPNDRQFQSSALTQSYPIQSCSTIPQTSLPYGQSVPYLTPLLSPFCNGFFNNIPQPVAAVPPHPQAALAAAAVAATNAARNCDPLRPFAPTLVNQISRRPRPSVTSKTNLYISGLHEADSDDTLRQIVESVVQPKSCKAMTVNGKCKGYGFIDCETEKEAELAMERINEYSRTTGRKLSVKFAFENEKDKLNVFVQHLPRSHYTTDDLMKLFKPYGVITSARLLDSSKGPTGIGFVRFSSPTEAEKAIKMMNKMNMCLGENTKAVTCKLADKADAQRRIMTNSEIGRNKFTFASGQSQTGGGIMTQSLQNNSISTGHLAALAQSASLPGQVLPPLPAFSFEVPGFSNHSTVPHTNSVVGSNVMPNLVSGSSTLVQLPYATPHPSTLNAQCPNLASSTNPIIGPPPHTQIPATVQSPQYPANLVSAYFSTMDVQQGTLKAIPTAVSSNRFQNTGGTSVMLHSANPLPNAGAQSDAQMNAFPPSVPYALSYGQQPPQTIAPGVSAAMSPQFVWLAPPNPSFATSSMFHNYGLTPAFQSSALDQRKPTHESQRSTPGLATQTNFAVERPATTSTITSMFQNLSVNGPLDATRFTVDSTVPSEPTNSWAYHKAPESTTEERVPGVEDQPTNTQPIAVSHAFDNSTDRSFTDKLTCGSTDFITSIPNNHIGHCDGIRTVNSSNIECLKARESNSNGNECEQLSEKIKIPTANGGGCALGTPEATRNGVQINRRVKTSGDVALEQKRGPQPPDSDPTTPVVVSNSEVELAEHTVQLSSTVKS